MDIKKSSNSSPATSPVISPKNSSPTSKEGLRSRLRYWEEYSLSLLSKYVPKGVPKIEVRSVFGWTDVNNEEETQRCQPDDLETTLADGAVKATTYSREDQLPRLPVPRLEDTCKKYLRTLEPILSPEEYEESKKAVEEFMKPGGVGEKLQQELIKFDSTGVPSWLEGWWDDAYLFMREPIAINVNYFFAFEDDPVPEKNYQVGRAASLLRGAMVFKKLLDAERLEPDMERSNPLCMSQYPRMFSASRIPGTKRDSIITYTKYRPTGRSATSKTTEYVDMSPRHVVVLYRNQFYSFDIFDDNGKILSIEDIQSCLEEAKKQTHLNGDNCPPIGVLTAWTRSDWAATRGKILSQDPANKETLETIQSALIIVCLDNSAPKTWEEVSRVMLHGPGNNRWFDKHNLIVCENGKAGLNFEHSLGDGSSTLRLADEMFKYSVKHGLPHTPKSPTNTPRLTVYPQRIHLSLNSDIEDDIEKAYFAFKDLILANESTSLFFSRFGGQFMKDSNLSPDAFVQIAIQLAYYKLFGRCDATYESASTKQFLHGRTETVRTVSKEAVAFCQSTTQPLMSSSNKNSKVPNQLALLRDAVNAHVSYMREAKEGRGVDRHLFGLRMIADQLPEPIESPAIFKDKAYAKSSHWNISTSHCGCLSLSLFGFGPVVSDGFGVGYMIKNHNISFTVTAKYAQSEYSAQLFSSLLEQSLLHMQAIVLSNPETLTAPPKSLSFTHPTSSAMFHYERDKVPNGVERAR